MNEPPDRSARQVTYVIVAALIAVAVAVPLMIAGLLVGFGWWIGPLLGVIAGAGQVWLWVRNADRRVLRNFGEARPDGPVRARIANLLEGLCLSVGTAEPDLVFVADDARNAMAVARGDRRTVVVTTSLATDLPRIELEGIVAELLVRLKTGDAENATLLASVVGRPFLDSAVSAVARPLAVQLMRRDLDEHRDVVVDQQAVAVTRYPPGLSAALDRIANGPFTPDTSTPGTDHLWMVPPPRLDAAVPHLPVEGRVDALREI